MPATLKSIAAQVGVSVRTVGRALNDTGYVKDDVRERIIAAATEMGYRPNRMAVGLKQQRSDEIVVLLNSVDELHVSKVAGFEARLRQDGFVTSLVMCRGTATEASTADLLADLRARRPAAITWFSGDDQFNRQLHSTVRENDLAYVVFGGVGGLEGHGVDTVAIDRQQGVYESVRYLIGRGRKRIAYLAYGPVDEEQNSTRLVGYRRAMAELGAPEMFIEATAGEGQFERGREVALRIHDMAEMADAVQAYSDEVALGFMHGLHERGVRVPLDIALVGFDNRSASQFSWPRLTTVAQPNEELGVAAAEIILAKLAGEPAPADGWCRRLPTRLVRRESA